ncbi:MAG: serine--tRNA ligase [Saprospiraceae bacterium]|nr:serine--tRNA ligase [Candidatus Vicinibacter affinis]MBP6172739.1 serine--tRNA ligase [Saprospiraceae bacterium]MBK6573439.1 serine--tRNA ligase [Candidatus Vicinibacter affinis]MBK6822084.1 serine--tRNA ligase [Candidatus Vicinibacter affinis]MBK7302119.1 serine--tRNA ligase [Candidatus Vicinibacter affinis]
MIELKILRNDTERVIAGLKKRNLSPEQLDLIQEIISLDDQRKLSQANMDQRLSQINQLSKEIGLAMKSNDSVSAEKNKLEVSRLKEENKEFEELLASSLLLIEEKLIQLPNIPHISVPEGKSADDNLVFKDWNSALPELPEDALPHWELAKKYKVFDMELGVKITGSGFILYRNNGAKLQRALINFFLDEASKSGYEEIQAPLMVNAESARATGQLPDKEAQMYYVEKDDLYLIPTAEVPVTNIYRDVILKESDFPILLTGYTPCFRREAGSYGAHVKGLNRVHQFDKVEIVRIEHPEKSYAALELMLNHVENLLQKLELPYRILRLCGGDMGFASAITYDFEVYSAAQKRWLEVSSVSNFETFQTNRMKLRFKNEKGETQFAHSLNGSALALARIVAAILENHQTSSGIKIPKALQSYFGKEWIS